MIRSTMLEMVTTLCFYLMSIDAHVSHCASQVLIFRVIDVSPCLRIDKLFRQPKIHDMDDMRALL